jgi:hypothetical protein
MLKVCALFFHNKASFKSKLQGRTTTTSALMAFNIWACCSFKRIQLQRRRWSGPSLERRCDGRGLIQERHPVYCVATCGVLQ